MYHQDTPMTDDEIKAAIDKLPESLQPKVRGFLDGLVQQYPVGYEVTNIIDLTEVRARDGLSPACKVALRRYARGDTIDSQGQYQPRIFKGPAEEIIEA
jgi:hypothetical protein